MPEIAEIIISLLMERGPLCASQLSVETGIPIRQIQMELQTLESQGVAQKSPDRDKERDYSGSEHPWSIKRVLGRIPARV